MSIPRTQEVDDEVAEFLAEFENEEDIDLEWSFSSSDTLIDIHFDDSVRQVEEDAVSEEDASSLRSLHSIPDDRSPSSPPYVPSNARLEFDERIKRFNSEQDVEKSGTGLLGPDPVVADLEKRIQLREQCLERARKCQRSSSVVGQDYFLPPPWGDSLVRHASKYRKQYEDYLYLEFSMEKIIKRRMSWLRDIIDSDDSEYEGIAYELERLLEWAERRGLFTQKLRDEKTAVIEAMSDLDIRLRGAIETRDTLYEAGIEVDEQGQRPITQELTQDMWDFLERWPAMRRRWFVLADKELEFFPGRFGRPQPPQR